MTPLYDTALLPENKSLNGDRAILPDDKYRVYINSRDGQNYINAIRVNVTIRITLSHLK